MGIGVRKPRVVFFGTGPVAATSLELLLHHCDIEAVITKPKPPHHRGNFPVLDVSATHKLKTYEVTDKQSLSKVISHTKFESTLGVLIDFGIIVGKDVIDSFEKGIVNSHFSLLPEWRGADPITFSILSGQKKTGVSVMKLVEGMDEGPLLTFGIQELDGTETTPSLTDNLIHLSDALLADVLPKYLSGHAKAIEQLEINKQFKDYPKTPSYSRKLTKADGILDFNKPADVLEREIRAFIEWPKSTAKLNNLDIVVTKAHIEARSGNPGIYDVSKNSLLVFCGENALSLDEVKPAGKQAMSIQGFLAGYRDRL